MTTHATVICEICGEDILTCELEALRVPMVGSMFNFLPNMEFDWHPQREWEAMQCPYCGFRPFGAGDGWQEDRRSLTVRVADGKAYKYTIPEDVPERAAETDLAEDTHLNETIKTASQPTPQPAPASLDEDEDASGEIGGVWVEPVVEPEGDGPLLLECVCGRLCAGGTGLAAHQRACKAFNDEQTGSRI